MATTAQRNKEIQAALKRWSEKELFMVLFWLSETPEWLAKLEQTVIGVSQYWRNNKISLLKHYWLIERTLCYSYILVLSFLLAYLFSTGFSKWNLVSSLRRQVLSYLPPKLQRSREPASKPETWLPCEHLYVHISQVPRPGAAWSRRTWFWLLLDIADHSFFWSFCEFVPGKHALTGMPKHQVFG